MDTSLLRYETFDGRTPLLPLQTGYYETFSGDRGFFNLPCYNPSMKTPPDRREILRLLEKELPTLREKYGVERLAIFGSYARGNPREDSDVDILVQFNAPIGLKFVELASTLEATLGRKVDIITSESLKANINHPRRAHIALDIEKTLTYVGIS